MINIFFLNYFSIIDEQYPLNNGSANSPTSPGPYSNAGLPSSVLPEPNPLCVQVEKFFLPFELACHSKTPKIVCSALDSIEKLVAYGHISYEFFEVRIFIYYLGCTYSVLQR